MCNSRQINAYRAGTFDPKQLSSAHFRITDSSYGQRWHLYKCKRCAFVFANPYLPENEIIRFYSQLVDQEYSIEAEGRAKNFVTILKRLDRLTGTGGRLLDVGAASGIFLNLARQAGYRAEGVEPSTYLVAEARKKYGIEILKGTIDDVAADHRYSVITLLDIIEHLVDPVAFLTKVDRRLASGGILVLVTPDINSLAAQLAARRWWHYRMAHLNFFSLKSLNYLLEKMDYRIILRKRYIWHFSLYYLITRLFPDVKKKKSLQKGLKSIHLKLNFFDSWEIYARKI